MSTCVEIKEIVVRKKCQELLYLTIWYVLLYQISFQVYNSSLQGTAIIWIGYGGSF
jgi:hypothetical protein